MTYATTAQMVERFTERECIALSDRSGAGVVDEAQLTAGGLVPASDEINIYLGRRYALPLAQGGVPLVSPPAMLVGICCDIARYRLTGTEVQETDPIRRRYKDAVVALQLLADGKAVFAESPDLVGGSNPNAAGASVKSNERRRLFGGDGCYGGY
ncbi:gp436 family protein [Roseateles chitinivorans]|uniref:gp436 family protein n=1 Tax=Roseateles chitinivorans TaxID=2917965 RepID=UPI003D676FEE